MGNAKQKSLIQRFFRFTPIVILLGLWGLFCAPYLFKSLVPFPSTYLVSFFPPWSATYGMPVKNNAMPDVITQIYPWKKLTIDSWKNSILPLWNPYSFAGTPHAANYQSAVFSPINLLFFIFPFLDAWSLSVLFQPIVAGVGMFLFLRSLARSRSGSLIGAVGFMFCNFITTWMAYATLGYAIGFLPWAMWAVVEGFQKKSIVPKIILSVSVAWSLVSGHFQISMYLLGTVFVFILYKTLQTKNWRNGIMCTLFLLFGITLASPQLLLTYNAYRMSTRSSSFLKAEVIPWQYVVTLFSPDFYGNPVTRNDWFGHYAEWGGFVGVIPLLFMFIAMSSGFKGYKKFFLALGAFAVVFAYPTPFVDLLVRLRLPVLSTSAASRIIVLLSFAISALAAFGVDEAIDWWKAHTDKKIILFVGLYWLLIATAWIVVLFVRPFSPDQLAIAKRNLVFPTIISLGGTTLLGIGFLRTFKEKIFTFVLLGLIILTCFDAYRFASKWMPFDPRGLVYPEVPSLTFLQKTVGINRVFGNIGGEVGNMFSIQLIEGYDALYQGRYGEFIKTVSQGFVTPGGRSVVQFDKHGINKTIVLQLLGVRYIYHRLSDGHNSWVFPYWEYISTGTMHQIYTDEQYKVFEYDNAFPRAFLASSYRLVHGDQKIIDTMFSEDVNLRDTLILEEKPREEPAQGSSTANIRLYLPNRVRVETRSESPKLLFLSDVYDPGWIVTIDGRQTKLLRADYDFRAVSVPAGSHMIEFTYFPSSFRTGLIIVALSLFAIVGIVIWEKQHENRYI